MKNNIYIRFKKSIVALIKSSKGLFDKLNYVKRALVVFFNKKSLANNKIFCLSFQRTGTTSTGQFLKDHGISVASWQICQANNWHYLWYKNNFEEIFNSVVLSIIRDLRTTLGGVKIFILNYSKDFRTLNSFYLLETLING